MNINLLAATGLDENLAQIVEKLKGLIDSFWIYIVIALAAVVVIWGAYIGIKIAIAGEKPDYRYRYNFRRGNGRASSHQRSVRLGWRIKHNFWMKGRRVFLTALFQIKEDKC